MFIRRNGAPSCVFHKLLEAKNYRFIALLIDLEMGLEDKNSEGRTPLLHAASKGLPELVKLLLTKRVDTEQVDFQGKTALDYAIELDSAPMVQLLLRKVKTLNLASIVSRLNPSSTVKKLLERQGEKPAFKARKDNE